MRLIVLVISLVVFSGQVWGATYYVNCTQPNDSGVGTSWATAKKSIQAALDVATSPLDEVWVAKGSYHPGGDIKTTDKYLYWHHGKQCRVFGGFTGTETSRGQRDYVHNATIIDGNGGDGSNPRDQFVRKFFKIAVDPYQSPVAEGSVILDGFTIQNCWIDTEGIVDCGAHLFALRNCVVQNIYGDQSGGAWSIMSDTSCYNCVIKGNHTTGPTPILSLDQVDGLYVEGRFITIMVGGMNFVLNGMGSVLPEGFHAFYGDCNVQDYHNGVITGFTTVNAPVALLPLGKNHLNAPEDAAGLSMTQIGRPISSLIFYNNSVTGSGCPLLMLRQTIESLPETEVNNLTKRIYNVVMVNNDISGATDSSIIKYVDGVGNGSAVELLLDRCIIHGNTLGTNAMFTADPGLPFFANSSSLQDLSLFPNGNNVNIAPSFSNPEILDFRLKKDSPLLNHFNQYGRAPFEMAGFGVIQ